MAMLKSNEFKPYSCCIFTKTFRAFMLDFSIKFGQNYLHLHEVESTNLYASDYIAKTYPIEGTVIRADYQSGGRGQIGRRWHSKADQNLLCTTILYPTFLAATHQFLLSKLVSVTLVTLLQRIGVDKVSIKWPNDIYVNHNKIAGILIQNQLISKRIKSSVVGVGLNVNQVDWPEDLPNPISLKNIKGQEFDLEKLMFEFLEILQSNYKTLIFKGVEGINHNYQSNLYLLGVEHTFYLEQESFKAIIKGVTESGKLKLDVRGEVRTFAFREISFRKS